MNRVQVRFPLVNCTLSSVSDQQFLTLFGNLVVLSYYPLPDPLQKRYLRQIFLLKTKICVSLLCPITVELTL